MQKFTVFTVIFAIVIISISAELLLKDYAQELYPSSSASVLRTIDDLDELQVEEGGADIEENQSSESSDNDKDSDSEAETENEVDKPIEIGDNELPSASDLPNSERINDLLPTLDIPNLKFVPENFSGQIFDVLTVNDVDPDDVVYGRFLQNGDTQIAAAYELELPSIQAARKLYIGLKDSAKQLSTADVNETNQFGESSFYINHQSKVNEVFVVSISENRVYAFVYVKALHETFKPFFGLLL